MPKNDGHQILVRSKNFRNEYQNLHENGFQFLPEHIKHRSNLAQKSQSGVSEIFRAIGRSEIRTTSGVSPRVVMRLERWRPPEFSLPGTSREEKAAIAEEVFVADVWQDAQGVTRVNKRLAAGEAALVKPNHGARPK